MAGGAFGRDNSIVAHYRFTAYKNDNQPRYVVVLGPQRQVIECQRLEPATDRSCAMATAIERLAGEGWQAEGGAEYGFVFIRRTGERRLLTITERDPYSTTSQSFDPLRGK